MKKRIVIQSKSELKKAALKAANQPDWMQVVLNQGPPCFHVEDGRFCFRAEKWDGHRIMFDGDKPIHEFVSLASLLLRM